LGNTGKSVDLLLTGLVGGAFAASLASRRFVWQKPARRHAARGLAGGALLGWGARPRRGFSTGIRRYAVQDIRQTV
jgi:hypothetical protein